MNSPLVLEKINNEIKLCCSGSGSYSTELLDNSSEKLESLK